MIISNLKKINNNKYSLTIDNQKYTFYEDIFFEFNFFSQKEIDKKTLEKIIDQNKYYECYYDSIKYITLKLRTEKEITNRLKKHNTSIDVISKVIKRLKDEHYLDDKNYIKSYINDQINLSVNGPIKILFNLRKLGFKDYDINNYLDTFDNLLWQNRIEKIINKKIKLNHNYSKKLLKSKLKTDLISLGYSESMFSDLLSKINLEEKDIVKKEYDKLYLKLSKKYDGDKLIYLIKQKLYAKGFDISNIEE